MAASKPTSCQESKIKILLLIKVCKLYTTIWAVSLLTKNLCAISLSNKINFLVFECLNINKMKLNLPLKKIFIIST